MLTFSVNPNVHALVRPKSFATSKPTTELGRQWLSEVWLKASVNEVDTGVNVDAYAYVCDQNTKKSLVQREVAMLSATEIENGARGVADTVAVYIDNNVDEIIETSEVQTLVKEFLHIQEKLEIEEGVNFWKVLKLASEANTKMIDKLRELIKNHGLGDLVESILRNKECFRTLEGVMV